MSLPASPYRGGGAATASTSNRECDWVEWSEPGRFAAEHELRITELALTGLFVGGLVYFCVAYENPEIPAWKVAAVLAFIYVFYLLALMFRPRVTARFEITPGEAKWIFGVRSFALETGSVAAVEPFETPRGTEEHSPDWDIRLVLRDGEKKELGLTSSEALARARAARLGQAFVALRPAKVEGEPGDPTN